AHRRRTQPHRPVVQRLRYVVVVPLEGARGHAQLAREGVQLLQGGVAGQVGEEQPARAGPGGRVDQYGHGSDCRRRPDGPPRPTAPASTSSTETAAITVAAVRSPASSAPSAKTAPTSTAAAIEPKKRKVWKSPATTPIRSSGAARYIADCRPRLLKALGRPSSAASAASAQTGVSASTSSSHPEPQSSSALPVSSTGRSPNRRSPRATSGSSSALTPVS